MESSNLVQRAVIDAAELGPGAAAEEFVHRLVRENRWSREHAARVIVEYKRFLWLAAIAPHSVTPSDAVDQVWHLHITDTIEYRRFCRACLGRIIEHTPSRGGAAERARFEADYERTLRLYQATFGDEPPSDIWPDVARRFGDDLQCARVNLVTHWVMPKPSWWQALVRSRHGLLLGRTTPLLLGGALAAAGCATAGRAFPNVSGPTYLALYLVSWCLCLIVAAGLRRGWWSSPRLEQLPELAPYEAAELVHPGRALDAALSTLITSGHVSFDEPSRTFSSSAPVTSVDAFSARVHREIEDAPGIRLDALALRVSDATARIFGHLEALGLVTSRPSSFPFWLALGAPIFGAALIASRFGTDRPIGAIVVLMIVGTFVAFAFFRPRRAKTPRGQAVLRALQERHWALPTSISTDSHEQASHGTVALAVGLFGVGVLAQTEAAAWSRSRLKDGSNVATGGCSSGDGGGGCSGDGGGGCGGGCGGCGG